LRRQNEKGGTDMKNVHLNLAGALWRPARERPVFAARIGGLMSDRFLRNILVCCWVGGAAACGPEATVPRTDQATSTESNARGEADRSMRCDRSYQTIDVPGALLTFSGGINDRAQIVGRFFDANGIQRGFVREANGTFRVLNVPGSIITAA